MMQALRGYYDQINLNSQILKKNITYTTDRGIENLNISIISKNATQISSHVKITNTDFLDFINTCK